MGATVNRRQWSEYAFNELFGTRFLVDALQDEQKQVLILGRFLQLSPEKAETQELTAFLATSTVPDRPLPRKTGLPKPTSGEELKRRGCGFTGKFGKAQDHASSIFGLFPGN